MYVKKKFNTKSTQEAYYIYVHMGILCEGSFLGKEGVYLGLGEAHWSPVIKAGKSIRCQEKVMRQM